MRSLSRTHSGLQSALLPWLWLGARLALVGLMACASGRAPRRPTSCAPPMAWPPLVASAHEARAQARAYPGDVGLERALCAARAALLHDDRDAESLAALLRDRDPLARARLLWGARLHLAGRDARAPRGETARHGWLFWLVAPALSDHVFWVVVGRETAPLGAIGVYTYGFN